MKRRKTIKLFTILLLFALSFTACGKKANTNLETTLSATTSSETTSSVPETSFKEESDSSLMLTISYEILRDVRTDDAGEEVAYAEYPKFSVTYNPKFSIAGGDENALSAVLNSINEEWQTQSKLFLDTAEEQAKEYRESFDSSYLFIQDTFVNITRCDADIVCILVARSVEEGGSHPNNDIDAYNINTKTGEMLELSDVIKVDDTLKETIKTQLYENYPELDFDDTLVTKEISEALNTNTIDWYFWEDQICIGFQEGAFGFSHAEGKLGVLLPLK